MNLLYRGATTLVALLFTWPLFADPVLILICEQCRDTSHSRDFGNYALNRTYGPESDLFEDELIIMNDDGGWVHVDLSFVLEENIISSLGDLIGLDLGIPTREIQLDTTTDTTHTDSYRIDLDMIDLMGPLPVGAVEDPDSGGNGTGGGGDSSGGGNTSGGGVGAGGAGSGSTGGGSGGGGGGNACTSAGDGVWHCVPY